MVKGIKNLIKAYKVMPAGKRVLSLMTFVIVSGAFITLFTYSNRPNYAVLFSGLDSVEALKITEKLRQNRIKYQLKYSEGTVLVPDDKVSQLRLDMAADGILPKGGSVGFEILDDMPYGTDEFMQKKRYQQALQGELEKTIKVSSIIDDARVHIVPGGDSLFVEEEKPAKATVVVKLLPGKKLNSRQLLGIITIVSGAVEGLKPENVSITDIEGGILTKGKNRTENHENEFIIEPQCTLINLI